MNFDCVKNSLGRLVPREVPGLGDLAPFAGAYARLDGSYVWTPAPRTRKVPAPSTNKVASSLRQAIERSGLANGMTISFHHHLRNGDAVVDIVLSELEKMGIRDLTLACEGVGGVHGIRTRSSGVNLFLQLHVELADDMPLKEAHDVVEAVERALEAAYPNADILIHADPECVVSAERARG